MYQMYIYDISDADWSLKQNYRQSYIDNINISLLHLKPQISNTHIN
jgi:hypothetical protein